MGESQRLLNKDLLNPHAMVGIVFLGILFFLAALLVSTFLRLSIDKILAEDKHFHIDRTSVYFLTQLAQIAIYIIFVILYAHLIPALHSIATAMLAGASVVSIVLGLAAQSTLGNLVSGIAVLLYRPFRLGDTIQVNAPSGHETGLVEKISLGYTILRTTDHRRVMIPNSAIMSQTTINLTDSLQPKP